MKNLCRNIWERMKCMHGNTRRRRRNMQDKGNRRCRLRQMAAAVVCTFILFAAGDKVVFANDYWMGDSAWGAEYYVVVSAPDGGVNFRWGPGVEYDRLISYMIPNGVILHVTKEATASNGNNWGFTEYEGMQGWIALTQVSVTDPPVQEIRQEGITFERIISGGKEHGIVTCCDAGGNVCWQYVTASYDCAQCERVTGLTVQNGYYYLVEDGTILALDETNGQLVWKNSEYAGAALKNGYVFDDAGNLYICGYMGPDLFVADSGGKSLYRKDSFSEKFYWPYELVLKDSDTLSMHFEGTQDYREDGQWINVDLNKLGIR